MEKITSRKLGLFAACVLAASLPSYTWADSPAERALMAKAQSLAARGQLDMAVQTWQQVLLSDPGSKEALLGIAKADMQLGKAEEAQQYLNRLRAAGGSDADISKIGSMTKGAPQAQRLNEASRLATQGQYAAAMRIYRDVFGDAPPAGEYALAYYDTEAAIPTDRMHAIEGLRKLANQFPANSRYAVTLGRVLTYDAKTRSEGMSLLQRYDSLPEAQSALKQASAWNAQAAQAPAAPSSVAAAAASQPTEPAPVGNPLEGAAYRALNSGRLDEAKEKFSELLAKQPNNPRALSGMGYVFMKQQDFSQAADYLERARAAGGHGLDTAISTSHFWQKMNSGGEAMKSGNTDVAIENYRAAIALKPSSADASEALAGALVREGNPAEAVEMFGRAVHNAPERATAWRGLFLAQSTAGDAQAAIATSDRMPNAVRTLLNNDPEYLSVLAQDNITLGRKAEADRVVDRALSLPFPNQGRDLSLDKQMQYAALLMTAKKYEPALTLYQQIVDEDPANAGAWRALIAAQHQLDRDDDAIATLGRMPESIYTQQQSDAGFLVLVGSIYQTKHSWERAQRYLERALSLSSAPQPAVEMQLADVYAAEGDHARAFTIYRRALDRDPQNSAAWRGVLQSLHQANRDREALRQLSAMPEAVHVRLDSDPAFLQTVASIQSATGQDQAALRTLNQISEIYTDRHEDEPVDAQMQQGWIFLRAGDDRRLYTLVSTLAGSPELSDDQQADLNRLWAAWSVRQANRAMAIGDQRRAMSILETAAQTFPGNADVYGALAGVYLKSDQPKKAVAIYSSLDMTHATLPQLQGAIGAALAASDMKQAEAWLETALDQFKTDPTILKMAAQYEQARGNQNLAAEYYRAALNAMGPASPADWLPQGGSGRGPGIPGSSISPSQQLLQLLAPGGRTARMSEPLDAPQDTSASYSERKDISWQDAPSTSVPTLGDFARNGSAPSVETARQDADDISPTSSQMRLPAARTGSIATEHETVSDAVEYLTPVSMRVTATRPVAFTQQESSSDASRLQHAVHAMQPQEQLQIQSSDDWQHTHSANTASDPENGLPGPYASTQPYTLSTPQMVAAADLPPLTGSGMHIVRQKTPREQIEEQLAVIQGAGSGWLGGSSNVDYRSGQAGFDRLSIFSAQSEGSGMIGPGVRATIIARPVLLDSGEAASNATLQQGSLPAGSLPYSQSAAGIGGELQLRTASWGASVGYTPHGFLVENVTGRFTYHPSASHVTIDAAREPILDTQLSYAGLRDEASRSSSYEGNVWGGVIANSGQLQLAFGGSRAGWYIQGGGQYITGDHVPDNKRYDGDGGAYWAVWQHPQYGNLTLGMNFFGMHYDHNLRYFTYGQGGYFSPAAYLLAGLPLTFNGHYGARFHYRVNASLGVQAFQEDSAPYFPLDPAIQEAQNNPYYPERTSVGGNYSFESEGAYAIAEHWYAGGFLSFNNSRDYASDRVGFFFRYLWRPQPASEEIGPTGLFPLQGIRPLQVP